MWRNHGLAGQTSVAFYFCLTVVSCRLECDWSGQGVGWDRDVPYLSLNPGLQFPSSPGTGLRACRRVMEEVAWSPQLTPTPGADTLVHLMRLSRERPSFPPPPTNNFFRVEVFSKRCIANSRSTLFFSQLFLRFWFS